jgi:hypothetical protein
MFKCQNFYADKPGNYIFLIWVLGFVIDLAFDIVQDLGFDAWDLGFLFRGLPRRYRAWQ